LAGDTNKTETCAALLSSPLVAINGICNQWQIRRGRPVCSAILPIITKK
jgi:hypothetical protein